MTEQSKKKPGQQNSRPQQKRPSPPKETEPEPGESRTAQERRAHTIENALRAMIRELYVERFGALTPEDEWSLNLSLKVQPGQDWALGFDPPLPQQLLPQMQQMEANVNVFQQGRIFCFRCERVDCEHVAPTSSLEVFSGYDQLGCPQWKEFAQFLLDLEDERIDALFEGRSRVLTRTIRGRDLRDRQLASFGRSSKTYALLSQVAAGYFDLSLNPGERTKVAMTFQAVESRDASGQPLLELNTLCHLPEALEYEEVFARRFPWVQRVRSQARLSIKQLEQQLRAGKGVNRDCLKRIPEIMRRLASDLERGVRQQSRQTQHARDRKMMARPIDMAMADMRQARPERMYRDLKDKTIVLCADRGRCHIFNADGRHVTSFVIETNDLRSRVRKRRWELMEPLLCQEFLTHFGSQGGSQTQA